MRGKKYYWTLAAVYLIYLTHGIQAIIISQNLDSFAAQWATTAEGCYKVISYTGLAKFLTVWICGEVSDRIGRKKIIALGAILYILGFVGLLTTHSLVVASICGFALGAATSCFDGGCYAAAQESWVTAPGTAVILIKGFISISGLIYPMLVVNFVQAGHWEWGVIIPIILSVLCLILSLVAPYSYDQDLKKAKLEHKDAKGAVKVVDSDAEAAAARFVSKPPAFVKVGCALYGFIAMATMFSAQQLMNRYGLKVIGMNDMQSATLTSIYTAGSLIAVVVWGFLMAKLKWRTLKILLIDLAGSVLGYALVIIFNSPLVVQISTFMIGFFAAGGALQCGIALFQEFNPGNKGRNVGIYYTFMGLASYVIPRIQAGLTKGVGEGAAIARNLSLNLIMAAVGLAFMIYLTANYKKWFGVSAFSKVEEV